MMWWCYSSVRTTYAAVYLAQGYAPPRTSCASEPSNLPRKRSGEVKGKTEACARFESPSPADEPPPVSSSRVMRRGVSRPTSSSCPNCCGGSSARYQRPSLGCVHSAMLQVANPTPGRCLMVVRTFCALSRLLLVRLTIRERSCVRDRGPRPDESHGQCSAPAEAKLVLSSACVAYSGRTLSGSQRAYAPPALLPWAAKLLT